MMKTTVELPDGLYRKIKAQAALRGQSVKSYFLDALQEKLTAEASSKEKATGWRAVFGKATAEEVREVQRIIDDEFSRIDPESWV